MAKRYNVSLPDSLVSRIGDRRLPLSAILQAGIYRFLEEEAGEEPGPEMDLRGRVERIERLLGLD